MPLVNAIDVGNGRSFPAHEHAIQLSASASPSINHETADDPQIHRRRNRTFEQRPGESFVHATDRGGVPDIARVELGGLSSAQRLEHFSYGLDHGLL